MRLDFGMTRNEPLYSLINILCQSSVELVSGIHQRRVMLECRVYVRDGERRGAPRLLEIYIFFFLFEADPILAK